MRGVCVPVAQMRVTCPGYMRAPLWGGAWHGAPDGPPHSCCLLDTAGRRPGRGLVHPLWSPTGREGVSPSSACLTWHESPRLLHGKWQLAGK